LGTQDEDKQNKNNPEKLATLGTQDEDKQNKHITQSRETGNIGYTRRRQTKQKHNTIQRNWQHRVHKTKTNKTNTQHNPEKLAT
jgi:hypothetical protein